MSEPPCTCDGPGDCPRYGVYQGPLAFGFCRGTACTPARSQRFRDKLARRVGLPTVAQQLPNTPPPHDAEVRRPPPDPGLGDDVERAIRAVGLDRLAKLYEAATGRKCGCKRRKEILNRLPGMRAVVNRVLGKDNGG